MSKKSILNKDTEFSIKLSKKHPNNKMRINGVLVEGYVAKNHTLPKGTDLDAVEVKAWFTLAAPVEEKAPKAKAPKE